MGTTVLKKILRFINALGIPSYAASSTFWIIMMHSQPFKTREQRILELELRNHLAPGWLVSFVLIANSS